MTRRIRLAPFRPAGRSQPARPAMWIAAGAIALLVGCRRGGDALGGASAAGARSAAAERPMPVAVAPAVAGPIASFYVATSSLEPEREADVVARVAGVVETIFAEEGDTLEEGAVLLEIESEEYRLRVALAQAKRENLESRYERVRAHSDELISAEELETLRTDLEIARSEEGLARLTLSYTRVVTPFSGRVTHRLVEAGSKVSPDDPLFRMADTDVLLARVHVPAKEFRKLRTDQSVGLTLDSTGERLEGRVRLVSPVIDPTTGTIKVTVEVRRFPDAIRPGDFAEVRIVTEEHPHATLVARGAVLTDRGEQVVYLADQDRAERRPVEVGFLNESHAEILRGVAPGERVVVEGQRSLRHGAPLKVLEELRLEPPKEARLELSEGMGS